MLLHRRIAGPLLTLSTVLGCAAEPTPGPLGAVAPPAKPVARGDAAGPPLETNQIICARVAAMPHKDEPSEKIAGDPAVLTPEGETAGFRDTLSVSCAVSLHGRALRCQMPQDIPPSLAGSVAEALHTWRFRPGTHDGVPVGRRETLTVPLVRPPPGWAPPPAVQGGTSVPFGQGMTVPTLLAGSPQPAYTREALEHCSEGRLIAGCTLTADGVLTDCDILDSVIYQDQRVLEMLAQQRYTPVMYQGHPQSVFYVLNFRFKAFKAQP
jgi:Gram-negative bacterial TonB protein C-terminal